jgi:hypothetical protein
MADPSATDAARGAALPARSWPPLPASPEPTAEGREAQIDATLGRWCPMGVWLVADHGR